MTEAPGVLVLTAAGALDDATAAQALAGLGAVRRLGRRAVEADAPAAALPSVRAALGGSAVDANWVARERRVKRLLVADMDGTVVEGECIDEIAAVAGVGPEVAAITARAMAGALDFEAALEARVRLLAGLPTARLAEVYATRVRLTPGARTLVATMRAHGALAALVSGGFSYFTARVAEAVGFDAERANRLLEAEGRLTGAVARPILGRAAKRETLERLAAERGLDPADALAVGDGANDLDMLRAAGLGVAFRAKPVVAAEADAVIRHADLTALLYLQGYHEDAFAT